MTQKPLGYIELEWTCPKCQTKNPGTQKTCVACGAPQPSDVQFEQGENAELIKDQAKIEIAKQGADIHCPFCGARNPALAAICTQCGGDIKEGLRRQAGKVVGAYSTAPKPVTQVACPNCGTQNPSTNTNCSACGAQMDKPKAPAAPAPVEKAANTKYLGIGIAIVVGLVILCIIGFCLMSTLRTSDQVGSVQSTQWERVIAIQALREVRREDWQKDIPTSAQIGSCDKKLYTTQSQPEPGEESVEVCGTPYTKDTGTGIGEVVQDCEYEIYLDYCTYSAQEWQVVDEARLSGSDLNPLWPQTMLQSGQREGERNEVYTIVFRTDSGETYTYTTSDAQLYSQATIGSEWTLGINALGGLVEVTPR